MKDLFEWSGTVDRPPSCSLPNGWQPQPISKSPKDRWGGTPLDDAIRGKHTEVIKYLRDIGGEQAQTSRAMVSGLVSVDPKMLRSSFTGLVDESDEHLLRISLFLAAGQPKACRNDKPRTFCSTDRSSWGWENLKRLTIKELAELECHAGDDYDSLIGSPIGLLSLTQLSAGNVWPFRKNLFPTDKYELTHSKGNQVSFQLDRSVFRSGTDWNSAEALTRFEKEAFQEKLAQSNGSEDLLYHELFSSPLSSITLPDKARKAASIPPEARFYSFNYPCLSHTGRERIDKITQSYKWRDGKVELLSTPSTSDEDPINPLDPFVQWLMNGAYVYYDHMFDIVAINALCFQATEDLESALKVNMSADEEKHSPDKVRRRGSAVPRLRGVVAEVVEQEKAPRLRGVVTEAVEQEKEKARNTETAHHLLTRHASIMFTKPCDLPLSTIEQLAQYSRWQPITVKLFREYHGYTHFAWITPSEFLGDSIFTASGGFAYLHKDDVVLPKEDVEKPLGPDCMIKLTKLNGSKFYPVTPRTILLDSPTEIVESPEDGTKSALQVHKYTELGAYPERGKMFEALEMAKTLREKLKDAPTPKKYASDLHIERLSQSGLSGVNPEKYVMDCKNVIFAEGKQSAQGLAKVLGFDDDTSIRTKCDKLATENEGIRQAWDDDWKRDLEPVFESAPKESNLGKLDDLRALHAEYMSLDESTVKKLADAGACFLRGETAGAYLQDIKGKLRYILLEPVRVEPVASNVGGGNAVSVMMDKEVGENATDRTGWTLKNFKERKEAKGLTMAETAALRIYTSSIFRLINGPLRRPDAVRQLPDMQHPLALTTLLISTSLKKLRANHMTGHFFKPRYLYRGMQNLVVRPGDDFMLSGGAEQACMSTSSDINVVAGYAKSSAPLIFRIKVDTPMELGADIQWLSLFPGESETLYPPLTFLKPMFSQQIKGLPRGQVVTMKVSFPT